MMTQAHKVLGDFHIDLTPYLYYADEPQGGGEAYICEKDGRETFPASVWSAILMYRERDPAEWEAMARKLFGCDDGEYPLLMAEALLQKIQTTNKAHFIARNLIEVSIDPDGQFRLYVEVEE